MDSPGFEWAPPGHLGSVHAAVTQRSGGCSTGPFESLNLGRSTSDVKENVLANEARVLSTLRLPDRVARLRLEHGARILRVDAPGIYGPADALATEAAGLILWITVADCYPLVLVGNGLRLLGHCGWRGVAAGLIEEMTSLLRSSQGDHSPIRAWIGPGIGSCCYPVGPEVARLFPRSVFPPESLSAGSAPRRLDLQGEIHARLIGCGLEPERIAASGLCTSCQESRFFSHRRDGAPSGRMAALCW
jgi:polyphenol oxidase